VLLVAVGGILAWLLIPTPPPPEPPVDKIALLRTAAGEALQGFECAELSARVSQTGDIAVTGFVGTDADKQQVTARMQALPDVGSVNNNQLDVMDWPLCEMRGILRDQTSSRPDDPGLPAIEPGGAVGNYFVGDLLKPVVTARFPDDGYLYIDYVDGGADLIQHLLPSKFRPDNAIHPGTRVEIGSAPGEVYTLTEPVGTLLIVAIWTPVPLFSQPRPDGEVGEGAKQYLAELRRQLQSLAGGGYQNSLLGSYRVLTLHKR
jgi:hypothetical protein